MNNLSAIDNAYALGKHSNHRVDRAKMLSVASNHKHKLYTEISLSFILEEQLKGLSRQFCYLCIYVLQKAFVPFTLFKASKIIFRIFVDC